MLHFLKGNLLLLRSLCSSGYIWNPNHKGFFQTKGRFKSFGNKWFWDSTGWGVQPFKLSIKLCSTKRAWRRGLILTTAFLHLIMIFHHCRSQQPTISSVCNAVSLKGLISAWTNLVKPSKGFLSRIHSVSSFLLWAGDKLPPMWPKNHGAVVCPWQFGHLPLRGS